MELYKKGLLAIMTIFSWTQTTQSAENNIDTGKAIMYLMGAGATLWAIKGASSTRPAKVVCKFTGISEQDAKNILGITASLAWVGFGWEAVNGGNSSNFSDACKTLALAAPIAAAATKIASTETFQGISKEIPVIGSYVSCSNEKCEGICRECQLTKGMAGTATYIALKAALKSRTV